MSYLRNERCAPCEGGVDPLSPEQADALLAELDGWERVGNEISKTFGFRNYYEAMAFVNASAYVSHREDHHPDLLVGYKTCKVTYATHAIGGLSNNDFICAAKLDALIGAK
ncbi:Putative pterin-4-alpha-carbinolamine dehydratase [Pontiella desulfatans]|uniref:Putative pterin-4-alpha-carbinolamine dehydratase n=1 Tax=Pontiella desulfatans TaxID=2750659 RepID=A0A6C2UBR9_PONDE|nr:4a-hydroxytetrahydrobiopterin dehydratase [Pontiella desulfatans]VGO16726.1 Putative pterin-4-alpha-carbinolamine dehydratase [Pontiella desulfatans]